MSPLVNGLFDKEITSGENSVYRALRDCLQAKGIRKHGLFLLHGHRAVREMLERFPAHVRNVIFANESEYRADGDLRTLVNKARGGDLSVLRLSPELFAELDVFAMREPLLAVKTPDLPMADLEAPPRGLEILCALGDPANVGALLRSAAAFGAARVVLLKESASPFHPKAVRAASATTLLTSLARGPSISELTTSSLIALDMSGTPLPDFVWPADARLLLGEEGLGLPERANFRRVSIPIRSSVESLNAPIALSIALYAYRSQLNQNR